MMALTQERLAQLASYEAETGLFTCLHNRKGSKNKVGDVLGSVTANGYIEIQFDGKRYYAHRLAFLVMTGLMPAGTVDHINRNPRDNRWINLRDVTQFENVHNQNRKTFNNLTGFIGVHKLNDKYRAKIVIKQKQIHLGTFEDPFTAAKAYAAAKQVLQPPKG
jgi:hypothetical protein